MYTGYYAKLKAYRAVGLVPVGITRGVPNWYHGMTMQSVAPNWDMLNILKSVGVKDGKALFNSQFARILKALDAKEIMSLLPDTAVLLCYEKPGEFCHRRLIAEWLELKCNVVIPEFGYKRDDCPRYANLV